MIPPARIIQWYEVKRMRDGWLSLGQMMLKTPRMILTGREELLIEGHTGLFSYETKCVRVRTEQGLCEITGEGLTIDFFGAEDLLIRGRIDGVLLRGEAQDG